MKPTFARSRAFAEKKAKGMHCVKYLLLLTTALQMTLAHAVLEKMDQVDLKSDVKEVSIQSALAAIINSSGSANSTGGMVATALPAPILHASNLNSPQKISSNNTAVNTPVAPLVLTATTPSAAVKNSAGNTAYSSNAAAIKEVSGSIPLRFSTGNLGGRLNANGANGTVANISWSPAALTTATPLRQTTTAAIQTQEMRIVTRNAPMTTSKPLGIIDSTFAATAGAAGAISSGFNKVGNTVTQFGGSVLGGIQGGIQKVGQGITQTSTGLIKNAMDLIGIPYKYGGNTPSTGLDCSGFVRYVYQNTVGLVLPRQSAQMSRVGKSIYTQQELTPGDLVFFNTNAQFSHVGIYIGGGRFVHSPSTGKTIRIDLLSNSYWNARYNGARRITSLD